MKELYFCSLSSGSSGNCYYIGNESNGILIDAGISATAIRKFLKEIGISLNTIMGVLVTHNHSDHVRGLEVLTKRNNLPVFTTSGVWKSILSPRSRISKDCIREIALKEKFNLAGFEIEAFPVSHDAPETLGFHICAGDKKVTIVTDLGYIDHTAGQYIEAANLLVIESNYDEDMLDNGRYPHFLKNRIRSDKGHLSNYQCSSFLVDNVSDRLQYICLAHLSKNNNRPDIALNTLLQTFSERGKSSDSQLKISVLKRHTPSEIISLIG